MLRSVSPDGWVIGVDDTDMPSQGGTGQLARRLAAEILDCGLGEPTGVTRHQLYEGPGVPKTSRNSAAAIGIAQAESPAGLFESACDLVERESIPGSDPGIALAPLRVHLSLLEYAEATQAGLVKQAYARETARLDGVMLSGLSGDHAGVIGALAAVGLRIGGNDGRFVGLRGIREVAGVIRVVDILRRTAIAAVVDEATGAPLSGDAFVDVGDWVRPRLVNGRPVLVARRNGERWSNADARPH